VREHPRRAERLDAGSVDDVLPFGCGAVEVLKLKQRQSAQIGDIVLRGIAELVRCHITQQIERGGRLLVSDGCGRAREREPDGLKERVGRQLR
jgi:hypothetical protein